MKKMISTLLITLLALQLGMSCKKEPIIEPCANNGNDTSAFNQDFELLWKVRDERGFVSYGTVVTSTSVVYFYDPPGAGGDDIVALDKTTGDTLWIKQAQKNTSKHTLVGNKICYANKDLVCLDVLTGSELWRVSGNSNKTLNDFIFANNKIYAFFDLGSGIVGDSTKLYEINPATGVSVAKFTIYGNDRNGYNQTPRGMLLYEHTNGNDIIFVQSTGYKPSITSEIADYYAIDITNDSMYWDLGRFLFDGTLNSGGGGGSNPILVNSNVLVNQGWIYNASLNLETKIINWKTQVPNSYRTGLGKMAELNGKLFQSLGNASNFNIINTNDGSFYKNYNSLGFDNWAPALMKYNSHIYFSSNKGFYKMDGYGTIVKQLLRSEKLSETVSGTIQTFDIDPATGYIYATVGYNLVCFKEK